jgi:hypothetical protein
LWSVHGLYSYEASRVSNEEVSEIDIENGVKRESWRSRVEPTELVVLELGQSVVIVCNCVRSSKSSCQSNTRLIIVATYGRQYDSQPHNLI